MADNMVTLRGTIGREPERKSTSKGDVLEFSLATNERVRNPDGSWSDGATSWFRVNVWGQLMRNASVSLHRGQPVVVQGILRIAEFTVGGGSKSRSAELRALAIGHDLTFGTTSFMKAGGGSTDPAPQRDADPAPGPDRAPPTDAEPGDAPEPARVAADWSSSLGGLDDTPF